MNLRYLYNGVGLLLSVVLATGCYDPTQKAGVEDINTGTSIEYAPQMYHSEAYEPMTQIVDTTAGLQYWPFEKVGTIDSLGGQPHGEWYNSNYFNKHGMNMRTPPANTIRYKEYTVMTLPKDSLSLAEDLLINPYKKEGNKAYNPWKIN